MPARVPSRAGRVSISALLILGAQGAQPSAWLRSAAPSPLVLRLLREEAPVPGGGNKSFYVGSISVGCPRPQPLRVAFDTASGQVVLPSARCSSQVCQDRRLYWPSASASAVDINVDGSLVLGEPERRNTRDALTIGVSSLDLGDGHVTGDLMHETLCLGAARRNGCVALGMVLATELTETPFAGMPYDGTVGLGLRGLSIDPLFNFLERFAAGARGLQPHFGLYLDDDGGELVLGGHSPARLAGPLTWVPVVRPSEGFWQVAIRAVRVGNSTVWPCGGGSCRGIIDSGTSRLGVPAALLGPLQRALGVGPASDGSGCSGPDLVLELEGVTLTLSAADYASGADCAPHLAALDLPESFAGAFVLGEPLLRRFYSVYDWQAARVGFGLAAPGLPAVEEPEEVGPMQCPGPLAAGWSQEAHTPVAPLLWALLAQGLVLLVLALARASSFRSPQWVARLPVHLARWGMLPGLAFPCEAVPQAEAPEGGECVICLGSCEEECSKEGTKGGRPRWCKLHCGHHFHEDCILEWLWKSPRCPVCRRHVLPPATENGEPAVPADW